VTKDDDEEDIIDAALNVIVKAIKADVVAIEYDKKTYTRNISMSIAAESVSGTIQLLQQKRSPSLGAESLTSPLIGDIVTSVLRNHATPLQIALGVLINRKKLIKHMFDYKVTCSYDKFAAIQEVLCSGAIHKAEKRGDSPCYSFRSHPAYCR